MRYSDWLASASSVAILLSLWSFSGRHAQCSSCRFTASIRGHQPTHLVVVQFCSSPKPGSRFVPDVQPASVVPNQHCQMTCADKSHDSSAKALFSLRFLSLFPIGTTLDLTFPSALDPRPVAARTTITHNACTHSRWPRTVMCVVVALGIFECQLLGCQVY